MGHAYMFPRPSVPGSCDTLFLENPNDLKGASCESCALADDAAEGAGEGTCLG